MFFSYFNNIYLCLKTTSSVDASSAGPTSLIQLGDDLTVACKRRGESRRLLVERIGVSEPTLARMERGDPAAAIGIYATAL